MARTKQIELAPAPSRIRDKGKPQLAVARKTRGATAAKPAGATARQRTAELATPSREQPTPETEFMQAMQDYKKSSGRMFPTWSEVLEVLQTLGYRKPESFAAALQAVSESA